MLGSRSCFKRKTLLRPPPTLFTIPTIKGHCGTLPAPGDTWDSCPAENRGMEQGLPGPSRLLKGGAGPLALISFLSPAQKGALLSCHPHGAQAQDHSQLRCGSVGEATWTKI